MVSIDSEASSKKDVKKFSIREIAEIFPVFEIKISPENNLAFAVVITDKVYAELNKKRVRETSWYLKVLAQMHTLPESRGNLKEFRTSYGNEKNYT